LLGFHVALKYVEEEEEDRGIAQGPSLVIMAKSALKFIVRVPKIILIILLAKNKVKQAEIGRTTFRFFIKKRIKSISRDTFVGKHCILHSDEFELKFPELSRAEKVPSRPELGHFIFRAETRLTSISSF
jgi:hypothetical protein